MIIYLFNYYDDVMVDETKIYVVRRHTLLGMDCSFPIINKGWGL